MSSGISVEESCVAAFRELTGNRDVNTVIYRLSDDLASVVPEFEGNLTHDELLEALPAGEPRLVAYELAFAAADGARRNEIVLISWSPEGTAAEQRTVLASGCQALRDALDRINLCVQATGLADVQYDELVSRAS
ncbi:actin-binding ADF family protein [Streptomyces sp. NPDC048258]|uniref:actin-binding ADF family protein n=1 Tax=Streptomyces sp. NPDC048258 TaxID=3365527 RepID=UPI003724BD3A